MLLLTKVGRDLNLKGEGLSLSALLSKTELDHAMAGGARDRQTFGVTASQRSLDKRNNIEQKLKK